MAEFIGAMLLLLPLAIGLWMLAYCAARMSQGLPLLDRAPRKPAPWGGLEVGLVTLILIPVQVAFGFIALALMGARPGDTLTPQQQMGLMVAGSLSMGLLAVVAIALAMIRSDDWAGDLGWSLREAGGDLQIGLAAFFLLAPLTYGLQALMTMVLRVPSKHPLIELVQSPGGMSYFLLACLLAVVVAPVAEEVLFRWFLQGWLQNFLWPTLDATMAWLGRWRPATSDEQIATADPVPAKPVEISPVVAAGNPYAASHLAAEGPCEDPAATAAELAQLPQPPDTWAQLWPIVISAAIFALLHVGHGADWIPLFPFALGLGYLYYRTGRLLPSVTVHVLLNGTSMFFLWLSLKK